MRALLMCKEVEPFNAKKLYEEVIDKFDEYNYKQFALQSITETALTRNQRLREECFQRKNSDPTLNATIKSDKIFDYVYDFEKKIAFLKSRFTDDEGIIFHLSIEERKLDKEIMYQICKSGHKYYEIKKSCYLKIALAFGLIKLKSNNKCFESASNCPT